jgi:hypothetical protein
MTVKLGHSGVDEPRAPLGKIVKLGHSGEPSRTTTTEFGLAAACVVAGLLAFFALGGAKMETDRSISLGPAPIQDECVGPMSAMVRATHEDYLALARQACRAAAIAGH